MTGLGSRVSERWFVWGAGPSPRGILLCSQDEKERSPSQLIRKTLRIECLQRKSFYCYLFKGSEFINRFILLCQYKAYFLLQISLHSFSLHIIRELLLHHLVATETIQSFPHHGSMQVTKWQLEFSGAFNNRVSGSVHVQKKLHLARGALPHPNQPQSIISPAETWPHSVRLVESQLSGTWQQVEALQVPISGSCLPPLAAQWQLFNVCWFFIKD